MNKIFENLPRSLIFFGNKIKFDRVSLWKIISETFDRVSLWKIISKTFDRVSLWRNIYGTFDRVSLCKIISETFDRVCWSLAVKPGLPFSSHRWGVLYYNLFQN